MKALPFEEAVEWAAKRNVILPKKYYSAQNKEYRTLTFSIAGINNMHVLADTLETLVSAIQNGVTFKEWKVQAKEKLSLPNHRLSNIYETNVQGAYNSGIYQQQAENVDINPYYMLTAVLDSSTRPSHKALSGYIAKYDDPFWLTHSPLLGYRCRCKRVALSLEAAIKRGYGKQKTPVEVPDKGFDYDKTKGLKTGINEALKNVNKKIAAVEGELSTLISTQDKTKPSETKPSQKKTTSIILKAFLTWLTSKAIIE